MPFSFCVNKNSSFSIYEKNILDILASPKEAAIEHRSGWQKFTDLIYRFCGWITDEEKISTLYEEVRVASTSGRTSADFIFEFWQLSELFTPQERSNFLDAFRLKVEPSCQGQGVDVTFYLDDADPTHSQTIQFENGFELPEQIFELTTESTFCLKREVINDPTLFSRYCIDSLFKVGELDEAIGLLDSLRHSEGSMAFQETILKLEKCVADDKKQQFYQAFQLEITRANDISTVDVWVGGTLITTVKFQGEFTPHDRLWWEGKESRFRLIEDNKEVQTLYIKSLNMQVEWDFCPYKESVLEQANQPLYNEKNQSIQQFRGDMYRACRSFPVKTLIDDKLAQIPPGTPIIETQESFRQMVREYFSPNIEKTSKEFKELYQEYSELDQDAQYELWLVVDKQKAQLTENLASIKEKFDQLTETEQKAMKGCFKFLQYNQFHGTDEEFKEALDKLPFKWKAFFIAGVHQGFRAPLAVHDLSITVPNGHLVWLHKVNDIYENKCTVEEEARKVEVEVTRRVDYAPFGDPSLLKGELSNVAHGVVKAKYTIVFPENGNIVIPENGTSAEAAAITFHEEQLNFDLVLLMQDGSIPQDNRAVSIDDDSKQMTKQSISDFPSYFNGAAYDYLHSVNSPLSYMESCA